MSNSKIKAAQEARKFIKSLENLVAAAEFLEDAGLVEQAQAESQRAVDANRATLEGIKSEIAMAQLNAKAIVAGAEQSAKDMQVAAEVTVRELMVHAEQNRENMLSATAQDKLKELEQRLTACGLIVKNLRVNLEAANDDARAAKLALKAANDKLEAARTAMSSVL
jgi:hypothetical protein